MGRRLKFALVGCGRIAAKHVAALKSLDNAELVAVADPDSQRAEKIGLDAGVSWYTDYVEMLERHPEVEVVNILTPSGLHSSHVCDIVRRFSKHIVVEKPMALRLEDADEMIAACDFAGCRLFVIKQNRYNLPVQKLREALDTRRFGRLTLGTVRVRWCRDQQYYDQDEWRGTWALDGGVFANQASHHIDLLLWAMGQPVSVQCMTGTFLSDIEVEDTGLAMVRFASGAMGLIEATTATRPKDLEGSISVLGDRGTVVIGGFAVNRMVTWEFEDADDAEREHVMSDYAENPDDVYGFGHLRNLEEIVTAIIDRKKALVEGLEGRQSLEFINALYESAETGREVQLRYKPRYSRLGEVG